MVQALKIGGWVLVYVASIPTTYYYAKKRGADKLASLVYLVSYLINTFLPWVAVWYTESFLAAGENPLLTLDKVDAAIVIHITLTFVSAFLVLVWGSILCYKAIRGAETASLTAFLLLATVFIGVGTVIMAIGFPDWFMNREAYVAGTPVSWIWPDTIAAPVTYFRIALSLTVAAIPFIRRDLQT